MSTQHLTRPDAEPTPDRTRSTPSSTLEDPRTATDRAPRTFSHRDGGRLENLIDEWNSAFANAGGDEAA
ncbi:hypothetical protein A6E15_00355 [Natrinema saccharevitans]|uniref:Uncharacterized protein n=1 Tax=Natrinema saccharevitans TaxID=301967 RepID=A0A1S8ASK3_9EURY|nr:hypothetical protein [Natrinema saccharevitans]OLZ39527.1 hypothetical protein A6E15_00355 [Natrinema saccharevitans]